MLKKLLSSIQRAGYGSITHSTPLQGAQAEACGYTWGIFGTPSIDLANGGNLRYNPDVQERLPP